MMLGAPHLRPVVGTPPMAMGRRQAHRGDFAANIPEVTILLGLTQAMDSAFEERRIGPFFPADTA